MCVYARPGNVGSGKGITGKLADRRISGLYSELPQFF